MQRHLTMALSLALAALVLAAPLAAQSQAPPPAPRPDTGRVSTTPEIEQVEGKVSKVDPGANTVEVSSGLLGLFGRTLQVTPETRIQVNGQQASLMDIRQGARVKASYQPRDGKNLAMRIEATPAEERERSRTDQPARPRTQ